MRARPASAESFTSDAFLDVATNTLNRLSEVADTLVAELELPEPSTAWEQAAPTLGSRILMADEPDAVLKIVQESDAFERIRDRMGRDDTGAYRPERRAYGFGDASFDAPKRTRVAARALVCIAADVWFDAYAAGLHSVTRPLALRAELRSATDLIWNWGTFDHQALARALSAALRHPDGEYWMPFKPFTLLFERLALMHHDEDPRWCRALAERLSSFAVERLWYVKPGRSPLRHLSSPSFVIVRDEFGVDLGPAKPTSSSDDLVRAAVPWCWDVFFGRRRASEAINVLTSLASGLSDLEAGSEDANSI